MTPFFEAVVPEEEFTRIHKEILSHAEQDEQSREALLQGRDIPLRQAADEFVRAQMSGMIFANDEFQVVIREAEVGEDWPQMLHLSIKRLDKEAVHDWRKFQEIKNALVGDEHEAIEIYPAESRLVDGANQYHLWVFVDPNIRLPFGFMERSVTEASIGGSKQRPVEKSDERQSG